MASLLESASKSDTYAGPPVRRSLSAFYNRWNGETFRAFRRLLRREQRLPLCELCPA